MSLYLIRSYTWFCLEKRRKQSRSVLLLLVQAWVLPPLAKCLAPLPRKRAAGREDQPEQSGPGRAGQLPGDAASGWGGWGWSPGPCTSPQSVESSYLAGNPCRYCCTTAGGRRKPRTPDLCLPPGSCRRASVLTQGLRSEPHPRPHALPGSDCRGRGALGRSIAVEALHTGCSVHTRGCSIRTPSLSSGQAQQNVPVNGKDT